MERQEFVQHVEKKKKKLQFQWSAIRGICYYTLDDDGNRKLCEQSRTADRPTMTDSLRVEL